MPPSNAGQNPHSKPLSSGFVLLIATGIGHVMNLLFQVIISNMFGKKDLAEYGVMNTMLSIFGMVAIPAGALQLAIARQTAILDAKGDDDSIAAMLLRALRRLSMVCVVLVVVLLALTPWLKAYLKLDNYGPIFITVGLIVLTVILPVGAGALQGLKRFGWLSVTGVVSPFVRIALGVLLVWAGWQASGALCGTFAASLVVLILCMFVLRDYLGRKVALHSLDTSVVYRYLGPTLVSLIAYAGLVNLDMVIVKHYFSPDDAAQYSAASLFGRAIGWAIAPLCTVLFPHVWDESQHEANRALLLKFLLAAIGIGIAAALVCTAASNLLASILLRSAEAKVIASVASLIPLCAWAMLPIGVANVFLNFVMARGRYGFLAVFVAVVVLYLVAFALWHDTIQHVLAVVAAFGLATLGLFVAVTYGKRRCGPCE